MKGYKQINVKSADELYSRPAKQYESDSRMTNEAHDTNLIPLVVSWQSLTDNILSQKAMTPISKRLHFQFVKFI